MIISADKGNKTVVLDREVYLSKLTARTTAHTPTLSNPAKNMKKCSMIFWKSWRIPLPESRTKLTCSCEERISFCSPPQMPLLLGFMDLSNFIIQPNHYGKFQMLLLHLDMHWQKSWTSFLLDTQANLNITCWATVISSIFSKAEGSVEGSLLALMLWNFTQASFWKTHLKFWKHWWIWMLIGTRKQIW